MQKTDYPKITVVTPNFNQGAYLEETILSVIGQNYPNLEYMIIDGGSTDGSLEIINKYSSSLSYWVSEKDNGMYDAINKGFALSTGEIMCWINSDDYLHKNSLFTVARIFKDLPEVSWIQGLPNVSDANGSIVYMRPFRQYSKLDFAYDMNKMEWIQQESTFWRKELYKKAGNRIETKYKLAGDCELWMRFFQHEKLYSLNVLLGSFRLTQNNASVQNRTQYEKEAAEIVKKMDLQDWEKKILARFNNKGLLNVLKNQWNTPQKKYMFGYPDNISFNFVTNKFEK